MEENKSIEPTLLNEKNLYRLNIKELRHLGRDKGVPSPTTKSKKELIDYILNIVYGKVEVPIRNIYGRKPNENNYDRELMLKKITNTSNIDEDLKKYTYSNDLGVLKVASPNFEYITEKNMVTLIYCNVNGKHYLRKMAFIESSDDVEITDEFVKNFKLENLDAVEVIISGKLIKVISINGKKRQVDFDNIVVDGSVLHQGQSRDFYLSTKEKINEEINNLIKVCSERNITFILFTKGDFENKKIQSIKYFEDESESQIYKKLMQFVSICEKCALCGEDLIMAIEDGDFIKNVLSKFDTDVLKRIEKNLYDSFKNITKLGNIYLSFNVEEEVVY